MYVCVCGSVGVADKWIGIAMQEIISLWKWVQNESIDTAYKQKMCLTNLDRHSHTQTLTVHVCECVCLGRKYI